MCPLLPPPPNCVASLMPSFMKLPVSSWSVLPPLQCEANYHCFWPSWPGPTVSVIHRMGYWPLSFGGKWQVLRLHLTFLPLLFTPGFLPLPGFTLHSDSQPWPHLRITRGSFYKVPKPLNKGEMLALSPHPPQEREQIRQNSKKCLT